MDVCPNRSLDTRLELSRDYRLMHNSLGAETCLSLAQPCKSIGCECLVQSPYLKDRANAGCRVFSVLIGMFTQAGRGIS